MSQRTNNGAAHEEGLAPLTGRNTDELAEALLSEEKEMLRELARDFRANRYGSIVLVIHEGRFVEVTKTVRIRKSRTTRDEAHRA